MLANIFERFRGRTIERRGTLLFPPHVALRFIVECEERKVQLLGLDAFCLLPDERIQPIMDDSLDLSDSSHVGLSRQERFELAARFVSLRQSKDILFEMVIDDDCEEL